MVVFVLILFLFNGTIRSCAEFFPVGFSFFFFRFLVPGSRFNVFFYRCVFANDMKEEKQKKRCKQQNYLYKMMNGATYGCANTRYVYDRQICVCVCVFVRAGKKTTTTKNQRQKKTANVCFHHSFQNVHPVVQPTHASMKNCRKIHKNKIIIKLKNSG